MHLCSVELWNKLLTYSSPASIKVIREKIVRFLIDGEDWIRKTFDGNEIPPGRWGDAEWSLVISINQCYNKCNQAVLGASFPDGKFWTFLYLLISTIQMNLISNSNLHSFVHANSKEQEGISFDFDGSAYLKAMLSFISDGHVIFYFWWALIYIIN